MNRIVTLSLLAMTAVAQAADPFSASSSTVCGREAVGTLVVRQVGASASGEFTRDDLHVHFDRCDKVSDVQPQPTGPYTLWRCTESATDVLKEQYRGFVSMAVIDKSTYLPLARIVYGPKVGEQRSVATLQPCRLTTR